MPQKGVRLTQEQKDKMSLGRKLAREKRAKELEKVRQEVTKKKVILKQSEKDRRSIVKMNKSAKIKMELEQLKKSMENYKKGNVEKEKEEDEEEVENLESVQVSDLPEGFAGHIKKEKEEEQEKLEEIKEESEDDGSLEELTSLYKNKINMLEDELHSERKNKNKVIEKERVFNENDYNFYKTKMKTQKQVQVEKEFNDFIKTLDNQEHIKIVNESKSLYNHEDSFTTNMKLIKKHIKEQIKQLNDNKQAKSLADKNKQREQKFARKTQIQNQFSKLFKY